MKRDNFYIKLLTSSDAPIELHPGWDYAERMSKSRSFTRSQLGQLNAFTKAGQFYQYSLPLDYVSSGDAHTINTWWQTQADVEFTYNKDLYEQRIVTTKILNQFTPLNQHIEGRYTSFRGLVFLRSTTGAGGTEVPFTLNSPVYGVLDQNRLG